MGFLNRTLNNRYAIHSLFCDGLLATTYKAQDLYTHQETILKVLKPDITSSRPEDLIRFKREINQAVSFKHPHLARILELGFFEDRNFLVMEFVQGNSLLKFFQENKKFSLAEAVEIACQIASNLEYLHRCSFLHLDLRPSNVMVGPQSSVKVLDFGFSHLIEYTQIKKPEEISAVFSYISPEQSGIMKRCSDERSDLYSLGVLFYQLLTGESPFRGNTVGELLHQHMAVVPQPPRRLNPQLPEVLEQIVLKLLSKEPEARYQTAKGLLADLELFKSGNTSFVVGKQDRLKKLLFRTRLIGREEEFAKLKECFEKAKSGSGQITLVKGEAGRGKSRLVDEMRSYVFEKRGVFVSGRCFSQENKTPYQPFRDILNEYIDRFKKNDPAQKEIFLNRIKSALGELGEIILKINPNMQEVLGKQPPLVVLDPEREHRRFLMVASRVFLNLGVRDEPFVLFLDDLQWSDEASLSLLEEITTQIKDFPLFILGTYRDNEVNENHSLHKLIQQAKFKQYPLDEIPLALFDQPRLTRFLSELLLEDEERTADLSGYILDKSKGNPFFVIEITRQLVEEKALAYDEAGKHWFIDEQKLRQIAISTNIVDVVLRRIDLLDPEKLELLSYASVAGREFPVNLLLNLTKFPEEKLIDLIDDSISLQLLERSMERGKVLFVHDRIRDAFYTKVPRDKLKELHLKIAQSLEQLYQDNLESILFDLASHYTEAEDKDKALQYALPAAQKAKQNYANEEAIRYYALSIGILEEKGLKKSPQWIAAKDGLAEVYLTIGKSDEAIAIAKDILPLKDNPLEKAKLYRYLSIANWRKGDFSGAEDALAKGVFFLGESFPRSKIQTVLYLFKEAILRTLHCIFPGFFLQPQKQSAKPEDLEIVTSYFNAAWMLIVYNLEKFIWVTYRVLNLARAKTGRSRELGMAYQLYGVLYAALPVFGKAIKFMNVGISLVKEKDYEWGVARGNGWLGFVYYWMAGKENYKKSMEFFQKSREIYLKIGDLWELAIMTQGVGMSHLFMGEYDEAIKYYIPYLEISEKIKDSHGVCCAQDLLSRAYAEKGELDKAAELGKESIEISEKDKIWFVACRAYADFGYTNMEQGNYEEAVKHLETARKIDKEQGATFVKDYLIYYYYYLADAYIERYKNQAAKLSSRQRKKELGRIRKTCLMALIMDSFWPNHFCGALRVNGKYHALAGRKRIAEGYFLRSIKHAKKVHRPYELGRSLYEYALFLDSLLGRKEEASQKMQEAFGIFKGIGARHYIRKTTRALGIKVKEEQGEELTAQERLAVERRLSALITVSHHLSSILELEELLGKIVSSAIEVSGAERGFLLLLDSEKKALQVKIAQGTEAGLEITPALDCKKYKLCRAIIDEVKNKASSLLYNPQLTPLLNQDEDIRTYQIKSVICTSLKVRGELLGLLYLDNCLTEAAFNEEDLRLINSFATQAGISLQNAFLVKEMVEKERLAEELKLGREIQMALLPKETPDMAGLALWGLMEPAKEIGGDYYDFIKLPDKDKVSIVIGDVSGKGVAAGLLMAMAKTAIHTLSQKETSPRQVPL